MAVTVSCNCRWCTCADFVTWVEAMLKNTSTTGLIGAGKIETVCWSVVSVDVLPAKAEVIKPIEAGHAGKDAEITTCDSVDGVAKS